MEAADKQRDQVLRDVKCLVPRHQSKRAVTETRIAVKNAQPTNTVNQ